MLKKLPLPVTGVALGFAALGNLIESYSAEARLICGAIALVLLLLYIIKIICYMDSFKEDMKNPIMASVFCTFSMAVMLLAGYVKPFIGDAAQIIWYAGILLHIILIIYFTVKFMVKPVLAKVFASYFIVYVGIVVASVTAPAFKAQPIGQAAFWFGFVMFVLLLIFVTYRYVKIKEIPTPAKPLFCIYTAPASLCLAGYMQTFSEKSLKLAAFIAVLSFLLYIIVLLKLPAYLKMPFFPSYAAFTFPFVISAIGMKMFNVYLMSAGKALPGLGIIISVQTIIAVLLVVYTLIRYGMFVLKTEK